ncbi:hypothetical protein DFH29DRAFT_494408 [Suillus ampliporus]|nr:hypothetical protein DFH29DRAFT_494408 [Suillus ampliporus]
MFDIVRQNQHPRTISHYGSLHVCAPAPTHGVSYNRMHALYTRPRPQREQDEQTCPPNFAMTLLPLTTSFVCAPLNLNGTLDAIDSASSCDTRSLWSIIWSCAATLFACTWTAIHPNIPGMEEGKFAITSRRLFIMIVALIAPELMITWAARQFFSAHRAKKDFNKASGSQRASAHGSHGDISESTATLLSELPESNGRHSSRSSSASVPKLSKFKEWTVTHGYFAWMGGFILYVDDKPRGTLAPHELLQFVREGSVDMPVITEADITDKSKGDGLSKGIAILQLVWFVAQLVARYVQNLPITLLEIDTLAVAALTCIAYGLWWRKPKDVGRPCIVHWKATGSPNYLRYDIADFSSSDGCCSRFFTYLIGPLSSLSGTHVLISPHDVHSRRVPSLGGYGEYHGGIILLIGCFSGMVFGGIHCLGWNFLFQRHTDQILWRAASLGIACVPIFLLLEGGCTILWPNYVQGVLASLFQCATIITPFIYISARVIVIVLMMLSLRSLPAGVYDTVAWTKFIPHL